MHDHTNNNGTNMKPKNLYGNEIMNWMRKHRTLKFTPDLMNYVLIKTWEAPKLSPTATTHKYFNTTHLSPLSSPDIGTNHQYCLAGNQKSNIEREDDIGSIEKFSIAPIDMEEVRKSVPMIILREKGKCRASRNLLIRAAACDTMRTRTVLPLYQINTVEREMNIQSMVYINNNPVEDDGCRLKPDSYSGIKTTTVKEAQCRIVAKNRRKQDEVKENAKRSTYVTR